MPTYYKLTQCLPGTNIIYTDTDLSGYLSTPVISISGEGSTCYTYEVTTSPVLPVVHVTVTNQFNSCAQCTGITYYKLTQCAPGTYSMYTNNDLSIYPPGTILKNSGGFCFTFEETAPTPYIVSPTIASTFLTCEACLAPPPPIYYKLTECSPGTNIFYTDTDLSPYTIGDILSIDAGCYNFEEVLTYLSPLITVTVDIAYDTCEECTKKCYTLISCQPSIYPNLYSQSNTLLEPFVGQLVNINGDLTKKYTVQRSVYYVGIAIDNADSLCSNITPDPGDLPDPPFPINYEITSFVYNGTEYVITPYTYSTTILNFQPLNCSGLTCTPATCISGTVNNYMNFADMLNGFFASISLPIQAYPYNEAASFKTKIAINYIESDTFSLNVKYSGGGIGSLPVINAGFSVDALGNAIRYVLGVPFYNYSPYITCIAPVTPYSSVTLSGTCYPCFTLTSCDGTLLVNTLTDLSTYIGSNISVTEFPGQCFTVVGNAVIALCTDTISVTGITVCDCIIDCGCPEGYILLDDGITCQEIVTVSATATETIYEVGPGLTPTAGSLGAIIYEDISTKILPVSQVGLFLYDNNGTGSLLTSNSLLASPSTYLIWQRRLIDVGVWTTLTSGPDFLPINEWIGFSVCVEVPETKTYCIGFACDNRMRLSVNGVLTVNFDDPSLTNPYPFAAWHIIPLTLNIGTNIIKLEGYNIDLSAGFGAEIYNATPAQITAVSTILDLTPYIIYSTKDLLPPNPTAYFTVGETSGYTCPTGYLLSDCDGSIACADITQSIAVECCYALEDCDTGATYVVSADLSTYVGLTITLNEIPGCLFVVDVSDTCEGSLTVTRIDSFASCTTCEVAPTPCYTLTDDCEGGTGLSFTVTNNLSASVGSVIKVCPSDLPVPNPTPPNPGTPLVPFVPDDALFQYNLINCCDPSEVLIVTNTLYPYIGQTISVPVLGNKCWTVTEILLVGTSMGFIDLTGAYAYTDCGPCMGIFPCDVPYLPELLECRCLTISEATNCTGAITLTNLGTISPSCTTCAPPPPTCYELSDCNDVVTPFIVCDDLSTYLGSVIKIEGCGDTCWFVREADNCDNSICLNGAITEFEDCEACLPPPPVPTPFALHARRIKPGYFSTNSRLTTEYIERVNCTFALEVYNQMIINRYGVTVCCDNDLDQWAIKKQVLDFELLTDPDLCKSTLNPCVPSCPDEPI